MIIKFKIFENQTFEPTIGDYVLLDIDEMNKHNIGMNFNLSEQEYPDNLGKLIDFNTPDNHSSGDKIYFYHIEFHNGKEVYVRREEMIRFLTPDEIEEYEMKKEVIKYNI